MKKKRLTKFEKLMAAVTFAEENEHDTAMEFLREDQKTDNRLSGKAEIRIKPVAHKAH